jgi:hypothetical protein
VLGIGSLRSVLFTSFPTTPPPKFCTVLVTQELSLVSAAPSKYREHTISVRQCADPAPAASSLLIHTCGHSLQLGSVLVPPNKDKTSATQFWVSTHTAMKVSVTCNGDVCSTQIFYRLCSGSGSLLRWLGYLAGFSCQVRDCSTTSYKSFP